MQLASMIAIYALFWVISAFLVLPIGIRTPAETGDPLVPGQAESAPVHFRPGRVARAASLLALLLFGLFYANYRWDWIDMAMLNRLMGF